MRRRGNGPPDRFLILLHLADPVQGTAAAGAVEVRGLDHHLNARKRHRQIADRALGRGSGRCVLRPASAHGLLRLHLGEGDGQLLEGQLPLVFGKLLRTFAMQGMVQLGDQMLLPAGDLPKRGDLLDQRERRRALRDRQGGEIQSGDSPSWPFLKSIAFVATTIRTRFDGKIMRQP